MFILICLYRVFKDMPQTNWPSSWSITQPNDIFCIANIKQKQTKNSKHTNDDNNENSGKQVMGGDNEYR